MIKMIGKFNVDYEGRSYDGNQVYEIVIISEFDRADKEIARKVFYFKDRRPDFRTVEQVENIFYKFPNYAKLSIESIIVTKVA